MTSAVLLATIIVALIMGAADVVEGSSKNVYKLEGIQCSDQSCRECNKQQHTMPMMLKGVDHIPSGGLCRRGDIFADLSPQNPQEEETSSTIFRCDDINQLHLDIFRKSEECSGPAAERVVLDSGECHKGFKFTCSSAPVFDESDSSLRERETKHVEKTVVNTIVAGLCGAVVLVCVIVSATKVAGYFRAEKQRHDEEDVASTNTEVVETHQQHGDATMSSTLPSTVVEVENVAGEENVKGSVEMNPIQSVTE